jgi:hypothetical protein
MATEAKNVPNQTTNTEKRYLVATPWGVTVRIRLA